MIRDYETEDPNIILAEFMERIALLADVDNHDADEDAVVMMTMHSAKGLEFPYVFMPGLEDGLFPGWRAFDREEGLEEERRLCYVGITRAKERLWMTSAAMRTMYGRTDYTRESQFLRELDSRLLEGDAVYEKKSRAFGADSVQTFRPAQIRQTADEEKCSGFFRCIQQRRYRGTSQIRTGNCCGVYRERGDCGIRIGDQETCCRYSSDKENIDF